ncbi:MAG: two-component regulator propeller domain-containing protein, partial [Chloroflexaceae bacterium]
SLPLLLDWRPLPAPRLQQRLADRAAALALTAGARHMAVEKLAAQGVHPRWTTFSSVNRINDILVDGETVWAATSGGLARWDVNTAEVLKLTTDDGLPGNTVTALAVDAEGALWLGTDRGAVQVRLDGSLRRFTVADGLADAFVYAVLGASDGAVWFGTPRGATRLGRDGRVRTVRFLSPTGSFPDSLMQPRFADVVTLAEASDGAIWLSTPAGVRVFTADGRQRFLTNDDLGDGRVTAFAFAPDGAVLMAVNTFRTAAGIGSGVYRLGSDRRLETLLVIEQAEQEAMSASLFRDLAVAANGALWAATESGALQLYPDGRYETISAAPDRSEGLISSNVQSVASGTDGSVWFGTDRGISRLLPDGAWQTLQDSNGPVDQYNSITALALAPNGVLWAGTSQGLSLLTVDGQWQTFLPDTLLSEITALAHDSFGDLWVGTGQGVLRVTPDLPEQIQIPDSPDWPTARVVALGPGADGSLWVGTYLEGVFRRDPDGNWRSFTRADGLAGNTVHAIAAAPDGSMWFGTEGGFSRLTMDGQWQRFGEADGFPGGAVRHILALADGSLLFASADIATGGSLTRRSADGTWQTLIAPNGEIRSDILCLAASPDGTIWIGTGQDGLIRLDPNGTSQKFTAEDGLAGNTVNALLVAPDGTVWVGTDGGLSRLT